MKAFKQANSRVKWNIVQVMALTCTFMIYGCAPVQEPKTVTYYKEHRAEREAMLARCGEDPGQLRGTPDCINASAAMMALQGQRKYAPPVFRSH